MPVLFQRGDVVAAAALMALCREVDELCALCGVAPPMHAASGMRRTSFEPAGRVFLSGRPDVGALVRVGGCELAMAGGSLVVDPPPLPERAPVDGDWRVWQFVEAASVAAPFGNSHYVDTPEGVSLYFDGAGAWGERELALVSAGRLLEEGVFEPAGGRCVLRDSVIGGWRPDGEASEAVLPSAAADQVLAGEVLSRYRADGGVEMSMVALTGGLDAFGWLHCGLTALPVEVEEVAV